LIGRVISEKRYRCMGRGGPDGVGEKRVLEVGTEIAGGQRRGHSRGKRGPLKVARDIPQEKKGRRRGVIYAFSERGKESGGRIENGSEQGLTGSGKGGRISFENCNFSRAKKGGGN